MNSHSLESSYNSFCNDLEVQVSQLNSHWPAIRGFWERWCSEHRSITQKLSAGELNTAVTGQQEPFWTEFLTRRNRMISALGQGANCAQLNSELRRALGTLVANHDKGFVQLLQKELEHVKVQMQHAYAVKKTVSAYANTAQFRGE
jgi:hypothetical protein